MPTTTPLTDAIQALTTYANETTGASDTTLSAAVGTLVAGYGQGGDELKEFIGSITALATQPFVNMALPDAMNFMSVKSVQQNLFDSSTTGARVVVFPSLESTGNYVFADQSLTEIVDLGTKMPNINTWYFSGASKMLTLIIRKASIVSIANINSFNGTPFASGKTGGTLYVPSALISSYQSATNWSTILGYANNQILPIEGSIYETQYADGTPIE